MRRGREERKGGRERRGRAGEEREGGKERRGGGGKRRALPDMNVSPPEAPARPPPPDTPPPALGPCFCGVTIPSSAAATS